MLSKASAFEKNYYGDTKWISFFIKDDDFLKKHDDIWNKVSNSNKKEPDCKPIYINPNREGLF